jgi:rhodanese-related sulfurtransferase
VTGSSAQSGKGKARGFHIPCLLAVSSLALSCTEPAGKPIPELRPAAAAEKPADAPAFPVKPGQVTRMPLGDLYQLVQSNAALIYDVRPAVFYKLGHVPGATSWPKAAFQRDLAKYEPQIRAANAGNTPVVIYCTDLACPDAVTVATSLAALGHNVSVLQGGYDAWKVAAD